MCHAPQLVGSGRGVAPECSVGRKASPIGHWCFGPGRGVLGMLPSAMRPAVEWRLISGLQRTIFEMILKTGRSFRYCGAAEVRRFASRCRRPGAAAH